MTSLDKGADQGAARTVSAQRPVRARLTIAAAVLAVALVFQPGESRAFDFGSMIHMFKGYHGKGYRHHGKGPRHIAHKGHRGKEKPAVKEPDGPIFTAAR